MWLKLDVYEFSKVTRKPFVNESKTSQNLSGCNIFNEYIALVFISFAQPFRLLFCDGKKARINKLTAR